MLYEVREYIAVAGRMPELIERFNRSSFRLFAKHHFDLVQIGLTTVGEHSFNEILYTLRFRDTAEMDSKWSEFLADPEVVAMFAETEADGPLVQSIRRRLIQSAPFTFTPLTGDESRVEDE